MAINKLLVYDSRPDRTGRALVHPASTRLEKTASESLNPDLVAYLASLPEPTPDEARAVITALSAYDTFGPNKNGDGFYREDLLKENDYGQVEGADLKVPMYESFQYFARPYRHHINRPTSPSYGKVLRAFWNPDMDRVELVVSVDRKLAPDIVDRIEQYGDVSTSMGFRAKYDVCNVCHNKARIRREYCQHLLKQMLHVLPDGRIVHARNPEGRFFDISFVIDPADLTSRAVSVSRLPKYRKADNGLYLENALEDLLRGTGVDSAEPADPSDARYITEEEMLEMGKTAGVSAETVPVFLSADLASANGLDDDLIALRKEAALLLPKTGAKTKKAVMNKELLSTGDVVLSPDDEALVRRAVQKLRSGEPMLSKEAMDRLADTYPLSEIVATYSLCGISLYPEEVQYMGLRSLGMPKTALRAWKRGDLFTEADEPEEGLEITAERFSVKLATEIAADRELLTDRSVAIGWLPERYVKLASMGPNPYVRRQRSEPRMAQAALDSYDVHRGVKDMDKNTLRYLTAMIMGAKWAIRRSQVERLMQTNPALFAQIYGGPGAVPEDLRGGTHPGNFVMTAPITSFIRGVPEGGAIYPNMGLMEHAMSKTAEWCDLAAASYRQLRPGGLVKTAGLSYDADLLSIYGRREAEDLLLILIDRLVP
jgi:hypothetical protein